MDMFKFKKVRTLVEPPQKGTLDSIHQTHVQSLKRINVRDVEAEISALTETLKTFPSDTFELKSILQRQKIEKRIQVLTNEVQMSMHGLVDYFVKNGDLMLEYYKKTDTVVPQKSVTKCPQTFQEFQQPDAIGKRKIFLEYSQRMGLSSEPIIEHVSTEYCTGCKVLREEHTTEGIMVCPTCGSEEYSLVTTDTQGFHDPPHERNNYAYKKMNHFNEILNQFQAKVSTRIPEDVFTDILYEIQKNRITNMATLEESDIRDFLKSLGKSMYYDNVSYILCRLNGIPPPTIPPDLEEKFQSMFQEIQAPFIMYSPDCRRNFLSYTYIVYKFMELLDMNEYKNKFTLLKGRDRKIEHDKIWKKICNYLQWEFIPSV